ncbi:MAG: glycosyltransferase, family [Bryobacterales bacterium]|nr:glycosyltransferase, family [Bryobacterales bacterium]
MSRFLLTVWPLQTHLHPFMAVAHGLRRRQHEVVFYTGASVSRTVQNEGFRCIPFEAVDERIVEDGFRAITSRTREPARWRKFLLGTVPDQLRDLESLWNSWTPHAVVCDMAMWGPILVLHESKKVPMAVLSHVAACLLPGPEHLYPGMRWLLNRTRLHPVGPAIAQLLRMATIPFPGRRASCAECTGFRLCPRPLRNLQAGCRCTLYRASRSSTATAVTCRHRFTMLDRVCGIRARISLLRTGSAKCLATSRVFWSWRAQCIEKNQCCCERLFKHSRTGR